MLKGSQLVKYLKDTAYILQYFTQSCCAHNLTILSITKSDIGYVGRAAIIAMFPVIMVLCYLSSTLKLDLLAYAKQVEE